MADDLAVRIGSLLAAEQEVIAPLARLHRLLTLETAGDDDACGHALRYARLRRREQMGTPWLRVAEPGGASWQAVPCPEPVRREYESAFRSLGESNAQPTGAAGTLREPARPEGYGTSEAAANAGVDDLVTVLARSITVLFEHTEEGVPGMFVLAEVAREAEAVGSVLHAAGKPLAAPG
jgi:hypothetical protein